MEKQIFTTKDYSIFKRLTGNRITDEKRVEKIKKSIKEVGYIISPLIVNEKMEIIDGQGRYQALKELDLPIDYIIQEGVGINECISMNINQKNWTIYDYIDSYAERGDESYIRFKDLLDTYKMPISCTSTCIRGVGKVSTPIILAGRLSITEEEYEEGKKALEYLKRYNDINVSSLHGSFDKLLNAVAFCYKMDIVNKDKLFIKIREFTNLIPPYNNLDTAIKAIEWLYNYKSKSDYVYIHHEYSKIVRANKLIGHKASLEQSNLLKGIDKKKSKNVEEELIQDEDDLIANEG